MFATLTLATAVTLAPANPPAEQPAAPGATVPDFTLKDTRRRPRSLADYKNAKAFVVVFSGNECPLANLYVPTLIELHKEYAPKGVQFFLINSNAQDSFVLTAAYAREREIPFPVLKDFDHAVADAFGARRTPEAFLLDAGRVIRYHGRIDDQYGISHRRAGPTRRDLKEAIDELLAGKPVSTPETTPEGCFIGRAREPRLDREVTYAKDVAPLMQKHCQSCHRPGEIGPMSLLTYAAAKSWAETIREVVLEERMPPWHADPRYGKFSNDRRMPAGERDTLLAWVEQGCPKGDEKDMPPPAKFPEGWSIGEPDLVIRMPEEYEVPATGVLPYLKFTVDPGFKEDVWVRAAECRPGNR
ncbi:MAG TPA: redoxin domain-containing protein, partial [Gemmataceae bacterium]